MPSLTIRKEWIGRPAPAFTLSDLNGTPVKLSSMRGQVVLLDFWSRTCPPCVHELPMIDAVGRSYKASDFTLWGISADPADESRAWLLKHGQEMPTLKDPDFIVSDAYRVQGIPSLVLVGRDGKIKNYWMGEVPRPDLEDAISQALKW